MYLYIGVNSYIRISGETRQDDASSQGKLTCYTPLMLYCFLATAKVLCETAR